MGKIVRYLLVPAMILGLTLNAYAKIIPIGEVTYIKGDDSGSVFVGTTKENLKKLYEALINNEKNKATAMFLNGMGNVFKNGTKIRILEYTGWGDMVKFEVFDDPDLATYWGYTKVIIGE